MAVERRKAFTGRLLESWAFSFASQLDEDAYDFRERNKLRGVGVKHAKNADSGKAPSRAKAHVAREAAQEIEMAQNIPIPKT